MHSWEVQSVVGAAIGCIKIGLFSFPAKGLDLFEARYHLLTLNTLARLCVTTLGRNSIIDVVQYKQRVDKIS